MGNLSCIVSDRIPARCAAFRLALDAHCKESTGCFDGNFALHADCARSVPSFCFSAVRKGAGEHGIGERTEVMGRRKQRLLHSRFVSGSTDHHTCCPFPCTRMHRTKHVVCQIYVCRHFRYKQQASRGGFS